MKRMGKKAVVLCAAVLLAISGMPGTASAGEEVQQAEGLQISREGNLPLSYTNPQDIILAQPGNGYQTTASKISILGAADYRYPLYMNGQEVATTQLGFFAVYVDLSLGSNTFTFTNNGKTKALTITRKSAGGGGSSSGGGNTVTYWSKNHEPQYAVVKGANISRMSTPGGDGKSLMMPLAAGTTAQIIGEAGNLYCLSDGSLVYKSNVTVRKGVLGQNAISDMKLVEDNGYDCTELRLAMNQNALYNLEVSGERALLTVYNMGQACWKDLPQGRIIKEVKLLEDGSKGRVTYAIEFQKNAPLNGYYVEFADGDMVVGFKKVPTLADDSLWGVRIHLDAGHGGSDTGAKGPMDVYGPLEKDVNLGIAMSAKAYLESKGATVLMTRTGDTPMDLSDRAARVASLKPDFSLSIHCNSMPVTADYNKAKGFLTFYSFGENGAAEFINSYIAQGVGIEKSGARYSNLAMTRMTGYPAVLFETAFMSNPADYQWLIQPETQQQVGQAAGEAVEAYIRQLADLYEDSYI